MAKLLRLTRECTDSLVIERSIWTLNNMCSKNAANQQAVRQEGGFDAILRCAPLTLEPCVCARSARSHGYPVGCKRGGYTCTVDRTVCGHVTQDEGPAHTEGDSTWNRRALAMMPEERGIVKAALACVFHLADTPQGQDGLREAGALQVLLPYCRGQICVPNKEVALVALRALLKGNATNRVRAATCSTRWEATRGQLKAVAYSVASSSAGRIGGGLKPRAFPPPV